MPSACACSVVKAAGTGPSSAVTVRGAGVGQHRHQLLGQVGRGDPGAVDRRDDADRCRRRPRSRASLAGLPNAGSSSPMAVCSAAGSMATASVPSSFGREGQRRGDRRDRRRRPSVAVGAARSATGADSAGVTVSSSTRWASAASTCTCGDVDGQRRSASPASPPAARAAVIAAAAPSRSRARPSAGSTTRRRGAVDGDRRVDRRPVDLLGDRRRAAASSAVASAASTGATVRSLNRRGQPRPGVQRLVRRRRRRCAATSRARPAVAGGEGGLDVVGDARCGRRRPAGPAASARARARRRRGRGRRCRRRRRRSSAGCRRRRASRSTP